MKIKKVWNSVKNSFKKKRRGVIPLIPIVVIVLIPVFLWLAWQFAKILIGETKEKV